MTKKTIYIYKLFERVWHWAQAMLILFLTLTGFEIMGSYRMVGFENAVRLHNVAAISLIILIVFAIFWHFTTGEWKQYIPTRRNLIAQGRYYVTGIFRNAPHPTRKTILSKLNPLQRLVYLMLKLVLIPLMVVSGLLYLFYRYPFAGEIHTLGNLQNLGNIAAVHTLGAYLLITFIAIHIYLITTGKTLTSNLKAMVTGYEEIQTEDFPKEEREEGLKMNKSTKTPNAL